MKHEDKKHVRNKVQPSEIINSGIIKCSGKIEPRKTNINGVCWCNCKGSDSTVHGWSAQGGPFK